MVNLLTRRNSELLGLGAGVINASHAEHVQWYRIMIGAILPARCWKNSRRLGKKQYAQKTFPHLSTHYFKGHRASHSCKGLNARANRYILLLRCAAHQLPLFLPAIASAFCSCMADDAWKEGDEMCHVSAPLPVCVTEQVSLCYMRIVPMGVGHCAVWGCRAEIKVKKQHRARRCS